MFHRVVPERPRDDQFDLCTTAADLRRTIRALHRAKYEIVSLEAALLSCARGERRRLACLTFDDGYADFYTHALPVLQSESVTATVFLVTSYLGGWNVWDDGVNGPDRVALLSPDQVRAASAEGIDFGSHSATHPYLSRLTALERFEEITASKCALEDLLQREISLFAYPFLDRSPEVIAEVRAAGYLAAVGGPKSDHTCFLVRRQSLKRFDPFSLWLRLHFVGSRPSIDRVARTIGIGP